MGGFAWVTLATNDSYSLGALVLAHSLRRVNTAHQLVVLVTPGVTEAMKTQLSAVFNVVKLVDVLDSQDADNLALLARPELGITFTKLHCWRLTQYDKCVFLDADTLVLQNCDELFDRDELSAAPDAGWPDCFNSGVFVYKPSNDTFKALIEFALIHGSFDGGDQGLLNLFFSDWPTKDIKKHLPFIYNMVSTASYSYLPAFKQFGHGLKIIHFIGAAKPWLQPFNTETGMARVAGESQHVTQFVQLWWDLFCSHVHPSLSSEMSRHRLSSSYDFTASPPSPSPPPQHKAHFGPRAPTPPPPSFKQPDQSYTYYDPWEDVGQNYSNDNSTQESFQNSDCLQTILEHPVSETVRLTKEQFTSHECNEGRESSVPNHHSDDVPSELSCVGSDVDVCSVGGGQTDEVFMYSADSCPQPEPSMTVSPPLPVVVPHVPPAPPVEPPVTHQEPLRSPSPPPDAGLAGALASVTLGAPLTAEQTALEEHLRRQGWEQGNIDYMGKDSFSNIWQKICDTLSSGPQPYLAPAPADETPAPVAPVAAPVYVSSVEISPTGPIDTSPPASYAPVSASKPTVVASDSESAANAALSETKTVPPEPKSPSVPELVSTEALKPTTLDTSSQLPADTPPAAVTPAVIVAVTQPATTTTSTITPTDISTSTIAASPVISTPPTTDAPIPLPATQTEITAQAPVTTTSTSTETVSASPVSVTTPLIPLLDSITPPATTTTASEPKPSKSTSTIPDKDPKSLVSAQIAPVVAPVTDVPAPTTPVSTPAPSPTTSIPAPTTDVPASTTPVSPPTSPASAPPTAVPTTPVFAPTTEIPVPTIPVPAPTTPVSAPTTPVPAPTTPVSAPTTPVSAPTTPVPTPTTPVSAPTIPVSAPTTPVPAPTTPVPAPTTPTPSTPVLTPTDIPVPISLGPAPQAPIIDSAALISTPTTPIAAPVAPVVPVPTPPILASTVPASVAIESPVSPVLPPEKATAAQVPQTPLPTTPVSSQTVSDALPTPTTSTTDSKPVTQVEKSPALASPPLPTQTTPSPSDSTAAATPVPSSVRVSTTPEVSPTKAETGATPVQPQTPTVTEPTPPTSPAATSVEAPLAAKLKEDTEVPSTPTVGSSSATPSIPSEEPPVPPKRKGGAKGSQDSKNHKGGGKPSKGKK